MKSAFHVSYKFSKQSKPNIGGQTPRTEEGN